MNVVDSSGWLEYFSGGDNTFFFVPAIQDPERLVVPSICFYEVFKRLIAQIGEQDALRAVGVLSLGIIVDLNRQLAIEAAGISMRLKLAMADSIILATTHAYGATLWSQDIHFNGIPGVKYIEKTHQ